MANEATLRGSLQVRGTKQDYRSNPTGFSADVSTPDVGPTPGGLLVSTTGTQVPFIAQFHTPGLCWIQNLDPTNYVTVGIYHPYTGRFFPMLELMPGEYYPVRLSRKLGADIHPAGTGSIADDALMIVADTAACQVRVDIFPK